MYCPPAGTKYPFFRLQLMDYVEWQDFIKFLGVLLDENLNCKEQIKYTENKIAKNLELLY